MDLFGLRESFCTVILCLLVGMCSYLLGVTDDYLQIIAIIQLVETVVFLMKTTILYSLFFLIRSNELALLLFFSDFKHAKIEVSQPTRHGV